jgi:uncharacterized membrane protein YphA (DoxX/SURF4 family)
MNIRQISVLLSRIALFVIYFWFGFLKVIGQSPASPMVHSLFTKTIGPVLPFLSFNVFLILFGLFEMLIGILFVYPGLEKLAAILFGLHMITTTLPIFVMGSEIWTHFLVPTLEGQYIIKNLALAACVLTIWSSLPPKEIPNVTM